MTGNASRAARAALLAVLCSALIAGCALFNRGGGDRPQPVIRVTWVSVAMPPNINGNWPVPVELVRVRNEALVQTLLQTETDAWFGDAGANFRVANPDAFFDAWEIVPGTSIAPVNVARHGRFGGVLFCGLREPVPPVRVAHRGWLRITVDEAGCVIQ
ncbi:MAG: hypothetical protein OXI73_08330 [Rhodospirillales bacterium]|nr:hypothetical protein [Rhodospirillales bacterium]